MPYSVGQVAKAAGISPRSVYVYVERRLIPPPLKEGRSLLYTEEHLQALHLVRVLLRLGLPLRQVEQLVVGREHAEVQRALAPVLPLAQLLDETERRVEDLQRQVRTPAADTLDLSDLGLGDPMRLRQELTEAERQRDRLQSEFDQAGAKVMRELIGPSAGRATSAYTGQTEPFDEQGDVRTHLDSLTAALRRELRGVRAAVDEVRLATEQQGFLAGLAAAYSAGWRPDPVAPPPAALRPELAAAFQAFVTERERASVGLVLTKAQGEER